MWILEFIGANIIHLLVLISAIGLLILPVLNTIPFFVTYKTAANYILMAVLVFGVFTEGVMSANSVWESKQATQTVKDSKTETKLAEAIIPVIEKTEEKVNEVKAKQEILIVKIPVYITEKNDSECSIPRSFIQLYDYSAQNITPGTTDQVQEGSSDVTLSELSETLIRNNKLYYSLREEFIGLREFYLTQKEIIDGANK